MKPRIHKTRPAHPNLITPTSTPPQLAQTPSPTRIPTLTPVAAPAPPPTSFQRQHEFHPQLHQLQLPLDLHPPLQNPHSTYHIEHFSPLTGGVFTAFHENSSAPLTCEPDGSGSNETRAHCRCNLI
jgi:hypothetical protein